jgi:hypothetical protein
MTTVRAPVHIRYLYYLDENQRSRGLVDNMEDLEEILERGMEEQMEVL